MFETDYPPIRIESKDVIMAVEITCLDLFFITFILVLVSENLLHEWF